MVRAGIFERRMGERYRAIHAFSELPAALVELGLCVIASVASRDATTYRHLEGLRLDPKNWRFFGYYCPGDPRVIVPKRIWWTGYSLNHAHKAAIPVFIGILATLGALLLFLVLMDLSHSAYWVDGTFVLLVAGLIGLCH